MTTLNYAGLFLIGWQSGRFFWGEGRRRCSLNGVQGSLWWPVGGALPPAVPPPCQLRLAELRRTSPSGSASSPFLARACRSWYSFVWTAVNQTASISLPVLGRPSLWPQYVSSAFACWNFMLTALGFHVQIHLSCNKGLFVFSAHFVGVIFKQLKTK